MHNQKNIIWAFFIKNFRKRNLGIVARAVDTIQLEIGKKINKRENPIII